MPTTDNDRLAQIRCSVDAYRDRSFELGGTYSDREWLLAEVDRLRFELSDLQAKYEARSPEARRALGYIEVDKAAFDVLMDANTLFTAEIDRLRAELAKAKAERDAMEERGHYNYCWAKEIEAAHTWTPATPATMPPVGSGPWLVEDIDDPDELYALYSAIHKSEPHWMNKNNTAGFPVRYTRYAALPAEPEE